MRRLLRLMTRRYRSFRSEVAKRPPSSCTIGRRSGGMTGRVDRIIHSGRAPDLRKASIRRRRLIAFLRRWPEVCRISTCSRWASSSRSSCSMIFLIASAPMPASNMPAVLLGSERYSDSVRVCMTLMSAICCSRGARRQLGVIGLAGDLLALGGERLVDAADVRSADGLVASLGLASALACLTSFVDRLDLGLDRLAQGGQALPWTARRRARSPRRWARRRRPRRRSCRLP